MQQFIETMFGDALAPDRRLCIFTTPDKRSAFFADAGQAVAYVRERAAAQNVYYGVGLVRGQPAGRGAAEDVAAIGALWADIDIAGPAHAGKALPPTVEDVERLLHQLPHAPSILVHSGHGVHAYWLLKEPWVFDSTEERNRAARMARGWHGAVCAIGESFGWHMENLGDLARILRLPGTLNHKIAPSAEVRIIETSEDRYNPTDFEPYLASDPSPPATAGDLVLRPDVMPPLDRMMEAASASPKFVETWQRKRTDLSDPSQSAYDLSLATLAATLGWADQEIADLIIAARRHHNDKPDKALRRDYIAATLAKARQAVAAMPTEGPDVDLSGIVGQAAASKAGVDPAVMVGGLRVDAVCLADVVPEPVRWLWPGRFALGKLSLIAGEPGLGKSFVTLDMAARVSRGDGWPCNEGATCEPAGVVLLSAEDEVNDTIAPRLIAAGADRSRILAMRALYKPVLNLGGEIEKSVHFSLLEHIPQLESLIQRAAPCRLVVVDPVSAFLGSTDSHNNSEVRAVLAPLAEMAARNHVAVVAVTHLNKGQGSALNRVIGSIAFTAAARAAYVVTRDEDDPARRLLLPAKNNLGRDEDGFAYRLEGEGIPCVEWEPMPVTMTADEAVGVEHHARGPEPDARHDAEAWLLDFLAVGSQPAQEVYDAAARDGHTRATIRRAKATMNIVATKDGYQGAWTWTLPGSGPLMAVSEPPSVKGAPKGAQRGLPSET